MIGLFNTFPLLLGLLDAPVGRELNDSGLELGFDPLLEPLLDPDLDPLLELVV